MNTTAFLLLFLISSLHTIQPGRIYVVPGSDSSVSGGLNVNNNFNSFDTTDPIFCSPIGNLAQTMDSTYRFTHLDSLGNPPRFTWWVNGGSMYNNGLTSGPWLTLELLLRNQYTAITTWGDELSYHYHNWVWLDYDGDGVYSWTQTSTFNEARDDFDITLGRMFLNYEIYPPSYRSGWNWMDTNYENRLDEVIPYRLSNNWSGAPSSWTPYHPSTTDYKLIGTMKGYETRHDYMNNISVSTLSSIFTTAAAGQDQIICAWSHIAEYDYPSQFTSFHARLWSVKSTYPTVDFEYCTALEAYKKYLKITDNTNPQINLFLEKSGDNRTIHIHSSEPLYQMVPLTAVKNKSGQDSLISAQFIDSISWKFTYNRFSTDISLIGVGGSDTAGNPFVSKGTTENTIRDLTPSIEILEPDGNHDHANQFYVIHYRAQDEDDNANISLYYNSDSNHINGTLLTGDIYEDSSNQVYWWDTSSISEGQYYIYGLIRDNTNIPVVNYSKGPLVISHSSNDTIPPLPVTGLIAFDTIPDRINLTWSTPSVASDGDMAEYYLIYRSLTVSQITTLSRLIATVSGMSTSWTDTSLTLSTTYYYILVAVDDNSNQSIPSNIESASPPVTDHVPPNPVINLTADTSQYFLIQLNWSSPGPASDGDLPQQYIIYRDVYPNVDYTNPTLAVSKVTRNVTFWKDTAVSIDTQYYYVVFAVDDNNNLSLASNEISVRPSTSDFIIDNLDTQFTVLQGTWTTASTTPAHWALDYRYIVVDTTTITGAVEWRPNIPIQGTYRIFVWYNQGTNRATDVLYIIHQSSNTTWYRVNQQINGGLWNSIGDYYFYTGSGASIELANYCPVSPGKVVMADAVRFVLISLNPVFINDWSLY